MIQDIKMDVKMYSKSSETTNSRRQEPSVQSKSLPLKQSDSASPSVTRYRWVVIDPITFPTATVPCIQRIDGDYLPVRAIERIILTKFVAINSWEAKAFGLLKSISMEPFEAATLNEINSNFVNGSLNDEVFTQNDQLVERCEFERFYAILKRTCQIKSFVQAPINQNHVLVNGSITMLNRASIVNRVQPSCNMGKYLFWLISKCLN
jgi:hypothetical protein